MPPHVHLRHLVIIIRCITEGYSRKPIRRRYKTSCWSATRVGSHALGMENQVSPLHSFIRFPAPPPASVLLTPPGFSLLFPRPGPSITNCVTYDTSDSWKRSSRVASLVRLPRPRRRASQYGHLARRVGIRSLRTIRSAGAQNPEWREMPSVLFKESKDRRQVRPRRT